MRRAFWLCLILFVLIGGFLIPLIAFGALPPVEIGVSITVEFEGGVPPEEPSLPGWLGEYKYKSEIGTLVLRGFAAPDSFLTVLRNKTTSVTAHIGKKGTFEVSFASAADIYEISLFIEDIEGNLSQSVVLPSIPVFGESITKIENIFIPPTVVLDTPQVEKGQNVRLHGYTVPEASVIVFLEPSDFLKRDTAKENGRWEVSFNADELAEGEYVIKVKAQLISGLISDFARILDSLGRISKVDLRIGKAPPIPPKPPEPKPGVEYVVCDLNHDKKVDLIDLSILLYNWGVPKDPLADLNKDGIVDLIDFSIMMFYWG